jgi:hypothetical protein
MPLTSMTRTQLVPFALIAIVATAPAAAQAPAPPDQQIAGAVQAAPPDRRAGAMVLGYDASGAVVTLRPGTNDMVCLADNPKVEGFNVACYHKDLEPFMARGRALAAQGTDDKTRAAMRFEEIKSGKLAMPKEPRTLYVTTGKAFDPATGQIADAYTRSVIYVPFATTESTGLAVKPGAPGVPWLMDPGTAGAHIMINPPRTTATSK